MIKIYGKNCIREAIRANQGIEQVFVLEDLQHKEERFLELLKDRNIKFSFLGKQRMDQEFGRNHQGFGAYHKDYFLYDEGILDEIKGPSKRILILDGIEDPHNLGAILRSVDAFGYDAVVLPKNRSCGITETVAHVSMGAIEHVKIVLVNSLSTFIIKLKKNGFWICGTDAAGKASLDSIDVELDLAVIIGSEGFGMSRTLEKLCDFILSIPMVGHVNSLNASVSAGIVLYELKK